MNNFEVIPNDKQRISVFLVDDFYNGMYDAAEDCVWFGGGADSATINRQDLIDAVGMWEPISQPAIKTGE